MEEELYTPEEFAQLVRESGHTFYQTNVGHSICSRCGLIPFDYDAAEPCPGVRP